jgi:UV DNA damage endonuclease
MRLGYACINMTLGEKKITTNRGMVKKTFNTKGVSYASELALQNVKDLFEVIKWNQERGITFYRMSSDMFPWMSEYSFDDLPNITEIKSVLSDIGKFALENGHRLTFHPGPFNVLASPNQDVVKKTILELDKHSQIMDMMGLPLSQFSKINIHVGGAYGDKLSSLQRWCDNFALLGDNTKKRLTIENDDKVNMFSVKDLCFIHEQVNIPIVFDYHHHIFNTGGLTEQEAFDLAYSTWVNNITPIFHVSEPRDASNPRAHHDYVLNKINTYDKPIDVMLECKAKERGLLKYRELYLQ